MPVPRAAQNLQMPYPRDWNGGQMPRSSPWWGGGGVVGLGAAGIDWCITEDVGRRASTAYRMIKKKKKKLIEPYYQGKISSFVGVSHRSFPFFRLRVLQVVFSLAAPKN